jgi:hypothetical protein
VRGRNRIIRRDQSPSWFAYYIITRWLSAAIFAFLAIAIALGWAHSDSN